MDLNRYISSGIIETYVVGLASDQEVRDLQTAMAQSPELRAAVDAVQQDIERYVGFFAATPPESAKERIFQRISTDGGDVISPVAGTPEEEAYSPAYEEEKPPREPRRVSAIWQYIAVAALAGLAITLYLNRQAGDTANEWKGRYEALVFESEKKVADNNVLQTRAQQAEQMLESLRSADTRMVRMYTVTKNRPGLLATVYINGKAGTAYLVVNNLPEPAADQQYQLWGLVNGMAVDAGVFNMGGDFQKVKLIPGAQMYAVTLEKKGGNPTPTLAAMYLAGKVGG
ncbi:anti-sigma factor [Chitinophaga lutea]